VVRSRRAALGFFFSYATIAILVTAAPQAHAGDMDPTPERLVEQPPGLPPGQTCQSVAANPAAFASAGIRPQDFPCRPNNLAFANLVSELGFAIAPTSFYPARTTGVAGFQISLEASSNPYGRPFRALIA